MEAQHGFEILDHTADIGFRAYGRDPAELFRNSALALQSIAVETDDVEEHDVYPIASAGDEYESLLVNFLSEVLYYLDGKRVVLCRFEFDRLAPEQLTGRVWGEPRDPERHHSRLVVKGITYHQLSVRECDGRWTAQVFVDI